MQKLVVFVDQPAVMQSIDAATSARDNIAVVSVTSETEALEELGEESILLTDISSPNGIEFLRAIRSDANPKATAPIVILTAPHNEQLAVQALRDIATSYVPVRLIENELLVTVDSVFSVAHAHQNRSRIMDCVTRWENEFILRNDRSLIAPLVHHLQESTQKMGLLCEPGEKSRLGIALEEALLNSMYHGNLEVPSELREDDDSKFYALVDKRQCEQPYCDRRIIVRAKLSRQHAAYVIEDEGPGFDVANVADPTAPNNIEKVCGRGMLLMRTFMDEVRYNGVGNQVTLVKRRGRSDPS